MKKCSVPLSLNEINLFYLFSCVSNRLHYVTISCRVVAIIVTSRIVFIPCACRCMSCVCFSFLVCVRARACVLIFFI